MRIVEELARRGITLRGRGINLAGACPKCGGDDRFGVNTKKNVWHCRGCGVGGDPIKLVEHLDDIDFVDAVMKLTGETMPKRNGNAELAREPPPGDYGAEVPTPRREITATYDYVDADEAMIYQVVRQEWIEDGKRKKSFLQRRPYGGIVDGKPEAWIWGLSEGTYLRSPHDGDFYSATKDKVERWEDAERIEVEVCPHLLFRWPQLREELAQPEGEPRVIMVVEGEKDVATLVAWGCCATTNSGGSANWSDVHAEELRGADVVVMEDNDQAGRKWSNMVALSLHGKARTLKILSWPDHWSECPDGGDVSDWAEKAGGDAAHLFEIVERLQDWTPPDDENRPQLAFLDPTMWEGQSVPPRRWLVPNRIPMANVTMLNGDGAAGKTTIALQFAVATVRGTDWLGSIVHEPGPVIFFTAEEDGDEIHRRLGAITEYQSIGFRDLSGLHLLCMQGADPVLGAPDRSGVIRSTPIFDKLLLEAKRIRPSLIVIEAAADVFAGNENDRAQVRQFIALLRRLALETGAAVLLIAHPSLTGLASGTGSSGSTAWNNSVRSRLYFTSAKKADDDAEFDARELKVMKSNYGPAGEVVRVRWQRGVFVPEGGPGTLARVAAEAAVDQAYLDCLDATLGSGRQVGPYPGRGYAPAIFAEMPQAKGYRAKALATAQERLFNAGRIEVRKVGPPSKALDRIFRKAAPSN